MKPVAIHRCVEIYQEIGWTEKRTVENWYDLELYNSELHMNGSVIALTRIFDMSYRPINSGFGFLYLHTDSGVKSLYVKTPPHHFIDSFKQLKQKA
ncbi:hypothetical protein [Desertibacillus haloalkaliphilus]|uniref:hypothetical protein n=1 Tax=Desertibacillus haloalkaliphilus TaxID=1328930 RepID=UPI001C26F0E5|nr:hypothetical protein [Desertibacillus haloalkaliphilus]MBU8905519.1 hypothetical protein [Desertibacillus haloalkaliphilus]